MTLIFMDGLQDAATAPKPEWGPSPVWGSGQTGRDGSTNGAVSSSLATGGDLILPSAAATCVLGIAVKYSAFSTANIIGFMLDGVTIQSCFIINTSGFIEVRRTNGTGTLIGTSSGHSAMQVATWYHVGVKIVLNSASAGSVVVQLNGVTVLTVSGVTTAASTASVTRVRIPGPGTGTTTTLDDIYVCDTVDATATQGLANNDFLGDVKIQTLFPTAPGDLTNWTPTTAVANWTTVDETPPNTTDYNSIPGNSTGVTDLYNLGDLTGSIAAIYGVRVALYATKSDAGSALLAPVLKENATVTTESGQVLSFGTWLAYCSAFYWRKPSASTLWTSTDVNALQIGAAVG